MKIMMVAAALALCLGLPALPAFAQSGNGPVAGVGPGGSGAGQSSLGPSKAFLGKRIVRRRHHRR